MEGMRDFIGDKMKMGWEFGEIKKSYLYPKRKRQSNKLNIHTQNIGKSYAMEWEERRLVGKGKNVKIKSLNIIINLNCKEYGLQYKRIMFV